MNTRRKFHRRSFLAAVTGAGTLMAMPRGASALVQGCSDTDSGSSADPGGAGRTCASRPQTGVTDRDPSDPAGRGRGSALPEMHGGPRSTYVTDRDPTDPAGRGRGTYGEVRSGYTDSDRAPTADPAGNGRGPQTPPGQQTEQERWASCVRLSNRRDELRRELLDPQYWGPNEIAQAQEDAARIDSLWETDEDGYIHGHYNGLMATSEGIAARYGLRCDTQRCTNVPIELRQRAMNAARSYNSAEHVAMRNELAQIEAVIARQCPGIR
jgi:hypothetical protein